MSRMNTRNRQALRWLINRVHKKAKVSPENITKVLGAIADLEWDWKNSKYDIYGLDLQDMLADFGRTRAPDSAQERGE